MATSKKMNYWYVLVMTEEGPKFVTGTEYHTAFWDKEKAPKELGKYWAEDICRGLLLNGYLAYAVCMPIEMENHPYNYNLGRFEWKQNKENTQEEESEDK